MNEQNDAEWLEKFAWEFTKPEAWTADSNTRLRSIAAKLLQYDGIVDQLEDVQMTCVELRTAATELAAALERISKRQCECPLNYGEYHASEPCAICQARTALAAWKKVSE